MSQSSNHVTFTFEELKAYRQDAEAAAANIPFHMWLPTYRIARFRSQHRKRGEARNGKAVVTEYGVFRSTAQAAEAEGTYSAKIREDLREGFNGVHLLGDPAPKYRPRKLKKEKKSPYEIDAPKPKIVRTPKPPKPINPRKRNTKSHRCKPVKTPLGVFSSAAEAAEAHGIAAITMYGWIKKNKEGFCYAVEHEC